MRKPTNREAREALEKARADMIDEGFHFPNEWLEAIDFAIAALGGKSLQRETP